MPIIKKQNEIDIYTSVNKDKTVIISESEGYFNEHTGVYEDICISIDVAHIDLVVEALLKCKEELLKDQ